MAGKQFFRHACHRGYPTTAFDLTWVVNDTSTAVQFHSSPEIMSDGILPPPFPVTLTTLTLNLSSLR